MKKRFKQIGIAVILQAVIVALFCTATYFLMSNETLVMNPLSVLLPTALVACLVDFVLLTFIYQK